MIDLMLDVITLDTGLASDLTPLFHENSKLWPYMAHEPHCSSTFSSGANHELLSQSASGIDLQSESTGGPSTTHDNKPTLADLGSILLATTVQQIDAFDCPFNALHTLRCYVLSRAIGGLPQGSYCFSPRQSKLIPISSDLGEAFWIRAAPWATAPREMAGLLVLTAPVKYAAAPHPERLYRTLLLTAGHIGQIALESAHRRRVGIAVVNWFLDELVSVALGLDPAVEQPVHCLALRG
jgi:hypothetical protein